MDLIGTATGIKFPLTSNVVDVARTYFAGKEKK
jgi:hypothetical protein